MTQKCREEGKLSIAYRGEEVTESGERKF